MSSWVGNPGRPPYVIPRGSAGLKKTATCTTGKKNERKLKNQRLSKGWLICGTWNETKVIIN